MQKFTFGSMTSLHRAVGFANVLLLPVFYLVARAAAVSIVGNIVLPLLMGVVLLTTIIWGVRNAVYYWRGTKSLSLFDHLLLFAGAFNGLLLLVGVAAFIYIGEN